MRKLRTLSRKARSLKPPAIFARFLRAEDGIGAIEFAILFPVLVMLYLGAFELTIGLSVEKRTSRAAGAISDIITQKTTVSKTTDLASMPSVASAIFMPYSTSGMTLKITGISIDANSKPTVAWSWAQDGSTPYAANSAVAVPTDLDKPSSFLVRTELAVPYELISFGSDFLPAGSNEITLSRDYFYRPRGTSPITCSGC